MAAGTAGCHTQFRLSPSPARAFGAWSSRRAWERGSLQGYVFQKKEKGDTIALQAAKPGDEHVTLL
jgi:hypothetical protein